MCRLQGLSQEEEALMAVVQTRISEVTRRDVACKMDQDGRLHPVHCDIASSLGPSQARVAGQEDCMQPWS